MAAELADVGVIVIIPISVHRKEMGADTGAPIRGTQHIPTYTLPEAVS